MQSLSCCYRPLLVTVLLVGCLIDSSIHSESGQTAGPAADFRTSGIRFRLEASIKADPGYAGYRFRGGTKASLAAQIRISAHARESQFYGVVTVRGSDFSLIDGLLDQVIWQDARCHQRRGFPKETVTSIDGSITTGKEKFSVHARARQVGRLLPSDEITQGTRLPDGTDDKGAFIAYRSQSELSHLFVDVKIYMINCELSEQ
jgi:hypothetical protein